MIIKKINSVHKSDTVFFINIEIDRSLFESKKVRYIEVLKLQSSINKANIIKYNDFLSQTLNNNNDLNIEVNSLSDFENIKNDFLKTKKDKEFNDIFFKNIFLRGNTINKINAHFKDIIFNSNDSINFILQRSQEDVDEVRFMVILFDENKFVIESSKIFTYQIETITENTLTDSEIEIYDFMSSFYYNIFGFTFPTQNSILNYSMTISFEGIVFAFLDFINLNNNSFIQTNIIQNFFGIGVIDNLENKEVLFDYYNSDYVYALIEKNVSDISLLYKNVALIIKKLKKKIVEEDDIFNFYVNVTSTDINKVVSIEKNVVVDFINRFENEISTYQLQNSEIECNVIPVFSNNIVFNDGDDNIDKIGIKFLINDIENEIYNFLRIDKIFIKDEITNEIIDISNSVFSFNTIQYNEIIDIKSINLLQINNTPLYLLNTSTTNFFNTSQYLKNILIHNKQYSICFKLVYYRHVNMLYTKTIKAPLVIDNTQEVIRQNFTGNYNIINIINNSNYNTIFEEIRNSITIENKRLVINQYFINEAINNLNFNIENIIMTDETKIQLTTTLFNSILFYIKIFNENMQLITTKCNKINFSLIDNKIQSEILTNIEYHQIQVQFLPFDKNISSYFFNSNNNESYLKLIYQMLEFEKNANIREIMEISRNLMLTFTNDVIVSVNKEKLFLLTNFLNLHNINKLTFNS